MDGLPVVQFCVCNAVQRVDDGPFRAGARVADSRCSDLLREWMWERRWALRRMMGVCKAEATMDGSSSATSTLARCWGRVQDRESRHGQPPADALVATTKIGHIPCWWCPSKSRCAERVLWQSQRCSRDVVGAGPVGGQDGVRKGQSVIRVAGVLCGLMLALASVRRGALMQVSEPCVW